MPPVKRNGGQPRQPEVPVIDDPVEPVEPKVPEMPPPVPDPPEVVAFGYGSEERRGRRTWVPRRPTPNSSTY